MFCLDLSNIWGQASLPDLLALEPELNQAHRRLLGLEEEGTAPAWLEKNLWEGGEEEGKILACARQIRQQSEICLVLAPQGLCLGAQGVISALQGKQETLTLLFAGDTLSSYAHNALLETLEGKDFSLILVSPEGKEPEFAAALRAFRWMLERKYGTEEAARRIYAVTYPDSGLGQTAREQGWSQFDFVPESPFDCLSPRWLLPLAVAGVDIASFRVGSAEVREETAALSFENPLWLHTGVRTLLGSGRRGREVLVSCEPALMDFARWYCHLFSRDQIPASAALLPRDSLESADHFATALCFDPPEKPAFLDADWKNRDSLGHLEGKPLDYLESRLWQAAFAQSDRGCPVLTAECGSLNAQSLGQLAAFFSLSRELSRCMLGKDRVSTDPCRENLLELLGLQGDKSPEEN